MLIYLQARFQSPSPKEVQWLGMFLKSYGSKSLSDSEKWVVQLVTPST